MADPLQKVNPTDALRFRADSFNAFVDAAKWVRTQMRGQGDSVPEIPELTPALLVFVKNTTGSTILENAPVVWDGTTPISPVTATQNANRQPVFGLAAPASNTDPVLITQAPIETDKIGIAAVAGVTVAQVSVSDASHRFARPIAGNTLTLESATSGPVRILGPWATGNEPRLVLILNSAVAGTAGGIHIETIPGAPDVDNVTNISITANVSLPAFSDNGWRIQDTSFGSSVHSVSIWQTFASTTTGGAFSIGPQTITGGKVFTNPIQVGGDLQIVSTQSGPNSGTILFDCGRGITGPSYSDNQAKSLPPIVSLVGGGVIGFNSLCYQWMSLNGSGGRADSFISLQGGFGIPNSVWIVPNQAQLTDGSRVAGALFVVGRYCVFEPTFSSQGTRYIGADSTGAGTGGMMFKGGIYVGGGNTGVNGGSF